MAIGLGAALLGSAVLGGASSAIAGSKASKAAQKAADENSALAYKTNQENNDLALRLNTDNNALLRSIYDSNAANLSPWMNRGDAAGGRINALLGLEGDQEAAKRAFQDYANSTGFQFNLQSGSDAIGTNKAASGLLRSGSTLKALTKYGQDLGSSYFGNYLGALQNQQAAGLSGASALAGAGSNYGAGVTSSNNNLLSNVSGNNNNLLANVSGNNDSAASAKANSAINMSNQFNGLLGTGLNALAYNGGLGSSYGKSSLPKGYGFA